MSVLLPVFNGSEYVGEAIESILSQTFGDFELIVIDDGSTDGTPSVLERYRNPRIRFYRQENRGLATTLNRAIALAKGQYLARQDQDDVSLPMRLAMQVRYMEKNPECALVGTWATICRENESTGRQHRHPVENADLKYELLLNNPFVHSSTLLRKAALAEVGGYSEDPERQPPEDYELWSRLARRYKVANIPEVLHVYREVPGSMSRAGASPFLEHLVTISAENIAWAAKASAHDANVVNIASLAHGAVHRVHGKPDIHAMIGVFRRAAEAVVPPEARETFGAKAEQRIYSLQFAYPKLFGVGLLRRVFHRAAAALRGAR